MEIKIEMEMETAVRKYTVITRLDFGIGMKNRVVSFNGTTVLCPSHEMHFSNNNIVTTLSF